MPARPTRAASPVAKPLAVPVPEACRLIGCGRSKMWEMIAEGRVKTLALGRRRLVVYASLEALVAGAA